MSIQFCLFKQCCGFTFAAAQSGLLLSFICIFESWPLCIEAKCLNMFKYCIIAAFNLPQTTCLFLSFCYRRPALTFSPSVSSLYSHQKVNATVKQNLQQRNWENTTLEDNVIFRRGSDEI